MAGVGSYPIGTTPTDGWDSTNFAAYAGKTQAQWQADIDDAMTLSFTSAETGFWNVLFNIDAAQSSADYANAQLSISNRTIKDLFDGVAGTALSSNWDTYTEGAGLGTIEQDGVGNADWVRQAGWIGAN